MVSRSDGHEINTFSILGGVGSMFSPEEEIDTQKISSNLYSSDIPDPDLVIRTSGEERVSNFLLWQIAYSELYFSDVHWPSFGRRDLYEAIEDYQMRKRRYGS